MNGCPEYQEILHLEIHGELDPAAHSRWQSHLRTCGPCREERIRMMRLMGTMKEVMTPPPLSQSERVGLLAAVRSGMKQGKEPEPHWLRQWLSRPWRAGPALVTACVFAAMISIWSLGTFDSFFGREPLQGIQPGDEEVIRNLDLLRHMDSVERLVQTLDEPEEEPSAPGETSNTHGMINHEESVHSA